MGIGSVMADRPSIRFAQGGRWSLRRKSAIGSEMVGRADLGFSRKNRWFLTPFAEVRRDVNQGTWSRTELGAEFAFKPAGWFTLAQGLHRAWVALGGDSLEWEIRTLLGWPASFLPRVGGRPIELYALNEYTYDLELGRGVRNETGGGIKIPFPQKSRWTLVLGWRHLDLIHSVDMDQFEGSLEFQF